MQRSTIAPDWFQAKAQEVKGEGYPVLKDVPEVRGSNSGGVAAWKGEADTLRAKGQELDAKAGEPIPTDEEVRAREALIRAQLDAGQPADTPKKSQP
jgi:hypothetical protein